MSKSGFVDGNEKFVYEGDRVEYQYGARRGKVITVYQDGDVEVIFDDGKIETVKFVRLCKI